MKKTTAFELVGVVLITIGLGLIYRPLAWLFVGVACFAASYLGELERRQQQHGARPSEPVTPITADGDSVAEVR